MRLAVAIALMGTLGCVPTGVAVQGTIASDYGPPAPYVEPGIGGQASISAFQGQLSPYGDWFDRAGVGLVWRPNPYIVGSDFVPYATGGQWLYTDYGWSFESGFDWGWAPFHYGRWYLDPVYGWCWVPGSVWGPAWVDWRYGDGLVGWAPLPPLGISISIGVASSRFVFVDQRSFVSPDMHRHLVYARRSPELWGRTRPVNRVIVHAGVRLPAGPAPQVIAPASPVPIRLPPPPKHQAPPERRATPVHPSPAPPVAPQEKKQQRHPR